MNKLAREARAMAAQTGKLPHEILLDIARGQVVIQRFLDEDGTQVTRRLIPTIDDIRDAAKAAAPYFAPKISTVEVIQGVSDHELDRIIALAAAEAGISIGSGGEGQEDQDEADGDSECNHSSEQKPARRRRSRVDPNNL
jgi:hypothetical protein